MEGLFSWEHEVIVALLVTLFLWWAVPDHCDWTLEKAKRRRLIGLLATGVALLSFPVWSSDSGIFMEVVYGVGIYQAMKASYRMREIRRSAPSVGRRDDPPGSDSTQKSDPSVG